MWLALASLAALVQDPAPAPPADPLHRVVTVEIRPDNPVLEGHGPSVVVNHLVDFSGTLHVWTKVEGELDTFLRVEDGEGKLLAEDDDSGGRPTPYAKLEVEAGRKLWVGVALAKWDASFDQSDGVKFEIHFIAAPETETTRAEAERAKQELAKIKRLREGKDLTAARTRAEALVERFGGMEGGVGSDLVAEAAWLTGFETYALSLLRPTEGAWRLALSHRTRTLPDAHSDLQSARQNLAGTIYALGDLAGARLLQEKVLEVRSRTLTKDHPDLQKARMNLAATLATLGDLSGARSRFEEVLEIFSRTLPDDHPDLQKARLNLAGTIKPLGDLPGARALEEKVLEVFSLTLPDDHPYLQAARGSLASTNKALGDLPGARSLEEKVLEVVSRTLPDDHLDLQMARYNLAITLAKLGDLQGARSLFEKVLEVVSRTLPDDHPYLQGARLNLAGTIKALGDLPGARLLEEKVLEVVSRTLPDDHPDLQRARLNLADTIKSLGDLRGARMLQEKALEVRSRTLPDDHPALQLARGNLALTHRELGDLQGARSLQEKVLEVRSRTLPDDHPDLQEARQGLAITIAGQARTQGAEEKEEGKERFVGIVESYMHGARRAALGAVLGASSREAEERAAGADALGRALSMARGYGVFDSDPALEELAFLLSESTRNVGLLSARLGRAGHSNPDWEKLRSRMREATGRLAALGQSGGTSEDFGAVRIELEKTQRELVNLGRHLDPRAVAAMEVDLAAMSSHLREHEALVGYRRYKRSEYGETGAEISTESLCAFVVRSGARAPSGRSAGAISATWRPGECLTRIELGPLEPIEKAVEARREAVGVRLERGVRIAGDTQRTHVELGDELRRLVLDPLREALAGAERIVIAADDVLHLVPLDALPAGEAWGGSPSGTGTESRSPSSSRLLGESLRIEVALSLLLHERSAIEDHTSPTGILLALGHPDFDREPVVRENNAEVSEPATAASSRDAERSGILRGRAWERGFATLPETRAEVRAIRQYYEDVFGEQAEAVVLEERKASRESLTALATRARFLHVATHGWFASDSIRSSEDPQPIDVKLKFGTRTGIGEQAKGMSPMLLAGLALAGANLFENELGRIPGLVTAEEISTFDLTNCELAVLSACDTNVGIRRAGQGVASLQKALHMAGARSVITSLWKVPDEATKELMLDFYRRLWVEKKPKWQALWEAKMKLRHAKDEQGRPIYSTRDWAAWVLTGEPD